MAAQEKLTTLAALTHCANRHTKLSLGAHFILAVTLLARTVSTSAVSLHDHAMRPLAPE
jgi:hypothetical protein